ESPWPSERFMAAALAIAGGLGVLYEAVDIGRIWRQDDYKPVFQDWVWYVLVPTSAYLSLAVASATVRAYPRSAHFAVAATTLTLLLTSIHNSWDSVTHLIIDHPYDARPD